MNIIKSVLLITSFVLSLILCYKVFLASEDTVYVDIGKLVEQYKFKKDIEGKATSNLMILKNAIDSMKLVNKMQQSSGVDSNIARLEFEFGKYYGQSSQEISAKVWERLNPAIEKFGKEHRYTIIIGANGAGSVLYGAEHADITNELIQYVNQLYEKGS